MEVKYKAEDVKRFIIESNAIEDEHTPQAVTDGIASLWTTIQALKDSSITPEIILDAHRIAMQSVNPMIAGRFRNVNVRVGTHTAPDHTRVLELVERLCALSPDPMTEQDIKEWHVEYEHIHPHEDGNGRTGRIIMCAQRMNAGLPIQIIYEKEKQSYYDWFI